ncbi:hypothetical protein F2Q69_00013389 [Brassica cretica]|uniref:Uncharacterized protein n=1 Tax=Brassica cretica TaxID=69181 RepID=A0A8S9R0G6_BRACR|nr:hypothetical protein F2Q69_00013389 [Brassica cretica]
MAATKKSETDLEAFQGNLLGSLLTFNAHEVFWRSLLHVCSFIIDLRVLLFEYACFPDLNQTLENFQESLVTYNALEEDFMEVYGAIKVEELSDHLVNISECVEADGSFKFEVDFMENFQEIFLENFMHAKSST